MDHLRRHQLKILSCCSWSSELGHWESVDQPQRNLIELKIYEETFAMGHLSFLFKM